VITSLPSNDPIADFAARFAHATKEALILVYYGDTLPSPKVRLSLSAAPDRILFPIRQIVIDALLNESESLILGHNHPSGVPDPSQSDIDQTRLLARTLAPLRVRIHDHIIVARGVRFSFRDAGLL
jgi:RadC-like JAB domain